MKVWVNGCFDVLHRGHIEMLKFAKSLGGEVMVGLDSDAKIMREKGKKRPFNCLDDRIELMGAIRYVDVITSYESNEDLEHLIGEVKPDIIVVGGDYRDKKVVGAQHAGRVEFFDRIEGYSTTKVLEGNI